MIARTRGPKSRKVDTADRYAVAYVPLSKIKPSPENDDIYGQIVHDEQMGHLIDSIKNRGLEEPLLLTEDRYILSGHRRFYAVKCLGWKEAPCRIRQGVRRKSNSEFHRCLAEYNPQRIKTVGSLLKEALLRDTHDTYNAIEEYEESRATLDVDLMHVDGSKIVADVSEKKQPFLEAVKKVISRLDRFWPLSIRQIHYNLLNDPPLISCPKRSAFNAEKYRYRNDQKSYKALVTLLTAARYHGHVSMSCIDDPTRPEVVPTGFSSLSQFIHREIDHFLCGYHCHRQDGQPRHIEIFAEKNTLLGMLRRVSYEYYVPLSIGRGFSSIPVWRNMARRFRDSGKESMSLIIVSDYDPEGLELADDAIRTLRDLWDINIEGHRVAVTEEQIKELALHADFNPAKESSSRYDSFVCRTGGEESWEVECLPPDYLIEHVKGAIEAHMDMQVFEATVEQEEENAERLREIKKEIATQLEF